MEKIFLVFIHLLAVIVALGGSIFVVFILSPVAIKRLPREEFFKLFAGVIRKFHPLVLGCYGILIMTGAWMLTQYKIASGVNFFRAYGDILIVKLGLVFVAMMIASYQFFGLGTGIVHTIENNLDTKDLPAKFKRLRYAALLNIAVILVIIYLGLRLPRI